MGEFILPLQLALFYLAIHVNAELGSHTDLHNIASATISKCPWSNEWSI